jgi:hypothetical protein
MDALAQQVSMVPSSESLDVPLISSLRSGYLQSSGPKQIDWLHLCRTV